MLDEKDLQAIARLMDEKIGASEVRMAAYMKEEIGASEARMTEKIEASEARMAEKIEASEARMTERTETRAQDSESRMLAMMEAYFEPRFQLLGDQIKLIQEKQVPMEAREQTEDRLDVLEAVVKSHSAEIRRLKKAQ